MLSRDDIAKILAMIASLFPNFRIEPEKLTLTVDTWLMMLQGFSYKEIEIALQAYVVEGHEFAPNVGQLTAKANSIKHNVKDDLIPEGEAWGCVYKAICNSTYNAETEYNALPQAIREAVGTPATLRQWAGMDLDSMGVVQSQFLRSYRAMQERHAQIEALPESVQARIPVKGAQIAIEAPLMIETNKSTCGMTDEQRERFKHLLG